MAKTLLINPSYFDSYGSSKAGIASPIFPTLGIMTIAATAQQRGHQVELMDLSYVQYDFHAVRDRILASKPDVIGITGTTPLMNQIRDISVVAKSVSKDIRVVAGGAHVSALPSESLQESMLDVVVVGEGDLTFPDLLDGKPLKDIRGIFYRDGESIRQTAPRPFVQNLDDLPLPAWNLYDSEVYRRKISRLMARRRPLTSAEFSRGCVFKCDFCASKNTMALGYRKKSPERCAEEVRAMHRFGYREFYLADDIFTSDNNWARSVADAIARTGLDISWTCTNGIRVESADPQLFDSMKKAGCYRVAFGFETGNEEVLKAFGKGGKATIEKGREAVQLARKAGIETNGFFMLGLSPDTEQTMNDTIEYARSLALDVLKFGITIPFPGTPMFREYRQKNLIRSYNWDDYIYFTSRELFAHPNLSFEKIQEFMNSAYKRAILKNPSFLVRRLWRGIKTLEFFWDLYYSIKYFTAPATNVLTRSANHFAEDRWPRFDFEKKSITFYEPLPAKSKEPVESFKSVEV
jgi:anaerobic magnesium-protoporphyrin IX monomethyl ester cyclase